MRVTLAFLFLAIPLTANAGEPFLLKDGLRVVFLGDSNTYSGKFITYLDAYLCTRFPDQRFELINLGLPSETVTGLSEPDHPYPRPKVFDRVDRALELTKPNVVVICYGMNDGIYSPFSEDRFKRYQEGITKLIATVEKAGAKAILMTPPPFDAQPLKDKLLPKDAPKFSWLRPYERYDAEVLTKYADWLRTLRDKKYTVIDAHSAVNKHLARMRKTEPAYRVSGDGIHPNADGHLVIALEILKEWHAPAILKEIAFDHRKFPPMAPGVEIKTTQFNNLRLTFKMPMPAPADPAWSARARAMEGFDFGVNRAELKIAGMNGQFSVQLGSEKKPRKRIDVSGEKLGQGFDLVELVSGHISDKSATLWKRIDEKNRILSAAWLTHVGHKRPDTPKGLPIAEATEKAAALDKEIRVLCRPLEVQVFVGFAIKE